jgi:hypothetical protein
MAAYVKYDLGTKSLMEAANSSTDTWQLILSNTPPNIATNTTALSATELGTAGGYTAGGVNCSSANAMVAGVYKLTLTAPVSPTWTASTTGFTFRYVILYNLTRTQCVAYFDYGSSLVMNGANGDTFTPTLDAVNGTFTVG